MIGPTTRLALIWAGRRSIGQTLTLVLVAALAALAIVTGLAAGDSAHRLVAAAYDDAGRPDLALVGDETSLAAAAADPAVAEAGAPTPVASGIRVVVDDDPVEVRIAAVDPDALPTVGRPELVTGRWPTGDAEVVVERSVAGTGVADVGDRLALVTPGGPVTVEIVGTAVDLTGCSLPLCTPMRLLADRSLVAELAGTGGDHLSSLRLTDPTAAADVGSRLLAGHAGLTDVQAWPDSAAEMLEAADVTRTLLAAVGLLLVLTACLVVAGATAARLTARRRTFGLLGAVGFRPGQLTAATLLEHVTIGAVGVVLGWVAGSLLAPQLQLGVQGLADTGGVRLAAAPLAVAMVVVCLVLAAGVTVPAWRMSRRGTATLLRDAPVTATGGARIGTVARTLGAGPSLVYGLRRALARPGRAVLVGAALLVAAVGISISTGFTNLFAVAASDTALTGVPWEAYASSTGAAEAEIAAVLDTTDEVGSWYVERTVDGTLDGRTATVRALGGDPEAPGFVVHEGRAVAAPGEAMVGYGFLQQTGRHVGDSIDLVVAGETVPLEVVGWFSDLTDGGNVVQVRQESLPPPVGDQPPVFRMVAATGVEPEAMAGAVTDRLGSGAVVTAPQLVRSASGEAASAMAVMILLLGGLAAANLLAVTVAGHRERARSFGILKAVGCTPRQLVAQSAAGTAAIGVVAGVLGVAIGAMLFPVFADLFTVAAGLGPGLVAAPGWPATAAVLVGTVAVATGVGALAAAGLARRPAADLVRYE